MDKLETLREAHIWERYGGGVLGFLSIRLVVDKDEVHVVILGLAANAETSRL